VISFDEATAIVGSVAKPTGSEIVALEDAAGRALASDLYARIDSPRRDVSAMDGYALRDADLATVQRFRMIGESAAGQVDVPNVGPGECVRIFTGAAVPPGADRVIIQEIVRRDGDWIAVEGEPGGARHIRVRGSDFASGDKLVARGTLLGPRALVAAAAADVADVQVYRRPRMSVIATGDELAAPGTAHDRPASLPESVSFGVAALCKRWGGSCIGRISVPDDLEQLEKAAASAVERADVVVVTGGASVGEKDFAKQMFAPLGLELLVSKVAIKPGKPVWLGQVGNTLVLGLPGNPTSAMVTARLFLAPLIAGLSGRDIVSALRWRTAALAAPIPACGDRETFLRARWAGDLVEPLGFQDSGAQKVLADADLLVRQASHTPSLAAGETVTVLDF
jgi:molybdopterin molybdotransferase